MTSAGLESEAAYGNVFIKAPCGDYPVSARLEDRRVDLSMRLTWRTPTNALADLIRLGR